MKNKKPARRSGGAGARKGRRAPTGAPVIDVQYDCRHFRGHIPCVPNKLRGKICGACDEYERVTKSILMKIAYSFYSLILIILLMLFQTVI